MGERPGAGGLSDRGAHGSLGAEFPCTCDPREAHPRDGVHREQRDRGAPRVRGPLCTPETPGAWSMGRRAPDARGSPEHSWEAHRLREEGGSGSSGLTPSSGSFFHLTEEAPAQGLGARPPFPEVQDSGRVGASRQEGLSALLRGSPGPGLLPAMGSRGAESKGSPSGGRGPWALAMPGH